MNARMTAYESTDRTKMRLWFVSSLAAIGGLVLLLASCSSTDSSSAPTPPASAAGVLSAGGTSRAEPTTSGAGTPDTTTVPSSSAGEKSSAPNRTSSPASATSGPTTKPSATRSSTSTTSKIVIPSFQPQKTVGPVMPASAPVSLTIPAIGVTDSPVLSLGLASDGSVQVPPLEDTQSSGWYNGSPTPGALGPSILLGHVDSAKSGPSVFYRLGDLRPGDTVDVTRKDGSTAVFRVDGVREYSKSAFPTATVYGNIDHAGLRLITCGGAFNPSIGHYESNIIAFASLVGQK